MRHILFYTPLEFEGKVITPFFSSVNQFYSSLIGKNSGNALAGLSILFTIAYLHSDLLLEQNEFHKKKMIGSGSERSKKRLTIKREKRWWRGVWGDANVIAPTIQPHC